MEAGFAKQIHVRHRVSGPGWAIEVSELYKELKEAWLLI